MPAEPVVRVAAVASRSWDAALLTDVERVRCSRLRIAADREAYVAAHVLVRECAAAWLEALVADVDVEQRCDDCGAGDHGRPRVSGRDDVHVSLSHTRGHVAAVAAAVPCGVDVEPPLARPLPRAVLAPEEVAWLRAQEDPALAGARLWVRKEALVKTGAARLDDVATLVVADAERGLRDVVAGHRLSGWAPPPGQPSPPVSPAAWAIQESPRYDLLPVLGR